MKKCLLLCLALCLLLSACAGNDATTSTTQGGQVQYTVEIRTNAGQIPAGIRYFVYKDASRQTGILSYGNLDASGSLAFMAPQGEGYVLVLENVPEGLTVPESIPLTGAMTQVVLESGVAQGLDATGKTYLLGDYMRDFTVTDTDGNTYTISELLKTKKCVVLNFWYISCNPCKAEFPYMQKAYEAYQEDIALIAMNPAPTDSVSKIAQYKIDMGLTFPMASCSDAWFTAMSPACPTTVVIDRYGRICFKETGSIQGEGLFEALFAHFTAEDYQQQMIRDIYSLVKE